MKPKRKGPRDRLLDLVAEGLKVSGKARQLGRSLTGNNFYADKLALLRSQATVSLRELPKTRTGDLEALEKAVAVVLAQDSDRQARLLAARDAQHRLRTDWGDGRSPAGQVKAELFPMELVEPTRRGYLVTVTRQMNGCCGQGWYDACAVMMRRLVEGAIIEAFEGKGIAHKVKNSQGDYFQLTELVSAALAEGAWTLSRNAKQHLPRLRDLGHLSAHSRTFTAQPSDIERVSLGVRVCVEEFLRLAGLLPTR